MGDRVVIGSTIGCGYCSYCRAGYYSQCSNANPNGPEAGTAFFGGPKDSGPFNGLQAMEPMTSAIDAYKAFDLRRPGWIKVELTPSDSAMPPEPSESKVLSGDSAVG